MSTFGIAQLGRSIPFSQYNWGGAPASGGGIAPTPAQLLAGAYMPGGSSAGGAVSANNNGQGTGSNAAPGTVASFGEGINTIANIAQNLGTFGLVSHILPSMVQNLGLPSMTASEFGDLMAQNAAQAQAQSEDTTAAAVGEGNGAGGSADSTGVAGDPGGPR